MVPVLIIGVSASGCSAAIYCSRRGIQPLLVGVDFGGEMALSGEVGNYPGFGATNGIELVRKFSNHIKAYDIEPELGVRITSLRQVENGFAAQGWKWSPEHVVSYEAKAIIIATGTRPRELGVPGEKEFRGKGLSYCTVCDGPLFKNKITVTIGGGNSANESGLMLADITSHAYVITKNQAMKGDTLLIERLKNHPKATIVTNAFTTKIIGADFISAVEYKDATSGEIKTIDAQGVFVHIGMLANTDFVMPELERAPQGEIIADSLCKTNIPGIFAAGDVTNFPYRQLGIASGQGIAAALSCVDYLNKLQ